MNLESPHSQHSFTRIAGVYCKFFFPALTLGVLLAITLARFAAVDDPAQRAIVDGTMNAGEPSAFMLHHEWGYGYVVASLYKWKPSIDWYSLIQLATCASAFAGIACVAKLVLPDQRQGAFVTALLALPLYVYFTTFYSFTQASIIASSAGIALIIAASKVVTHIATYTATSLTGIFLCVLGSQQRFDGFLLAGLTFTPVLIACIHIGNSAQRRAVINIAMLTLILLSITAYGRSLARLNGFDKTNAFTQLVIKTKDHRNYFSHQEFQDIAKSAGWNDTALYLFDHWVFLDPNRHTDATSHLIQNLLPARNLTKLFEQVPMRDHLKIFFLSIAMLSLFCIWFRSYDSLRSSNNQVSPTLLILCIATVIAALCYLTYFRKLPPRIWCSVIWCSLASVLSLQVFLSTTPKKPKNSATEKRLLTVRVLTAVVILTFLLSLAGYKVVNFAQMKDHQRETIYQDLTELNVSNILSLEPSLFHTRPFDSKWPTNINIIPYSSYARTPLLVNSIGLDLQDWPAAFVDTAHPIFIFGSNQSLANLKRLMTEQISGEVKYTTYKVYGSHKLVTAQKI